jgi:hypothetical protein
LPSEEYEYICNFIHSFKEGRKEIKVGKGKVKEIEGEG